MVEVEDGGCIEKGEGGEGGGKDLDLFVLTDVFSFVIVTREREESNARCFKIVSDLWRECHGVWGSEERERREEKNS